MLDRARREDMSFMDAVLEGIFTVPGDGFIDYPSILRVLADNGYQGWLVVEAEQDPRKAHPLTYATMGFENLSRMAREGRFHCYGLRARSALLELKEGGNHAAFRRYASTDARHCRGLDGPFGLRGVRGRDETRVVFVTHGQSGDPYWSVVKNGMDDAAKTLGVKAEYLCPRPSTWPRWRR